MEAKGVACFKLLQEWILDSCRGVLDCCYKGANSTGVLEATNSGCSGSKGLLDSCLLPLSQAAAVERGGAGAPGAECAGSLCGGNDPSSRGEKNE